MTSVKTTWAGWMMAAAAAVAVVAHTPAASIAEEAAATDGVQVAATAPEQVSHPPAKVAVVQFSSAGGEAFTSCSIKVEPLKDSGSRLSREVAEKLATWPEYTIIDPDTVRKAVDKHHLTRKGLEDPEVVRKLAALTGADAVVVGETDGTTWNGNGRRGGSLYASFRMLSTADARVLWTVDGQAQDMESSSDLIAALAADMTSRLFAQLQAAQGRSLLAMSLDAPEPLD